MNDCVKHISGNGNDAARKNVPPRFHRVKHLLRWLQPWMIPPCWMIVRAPGWESKLSLTFDDGPDPNSTPKLLDILDRCGVKGTFFFVGQHVEEHPGLVREAIARGHCVGNHGYDHMIFLSAGWEAFRRNILRGEEVLWAVSHAVSAWYFRPPRGESPRQLLPWAMMHRRVVCLWSLDSHDSFREPPPLTTALAPRCIRRGEVILLHEDRSETIESLPEAIERLKTAGHSFARIDDF
jgi:peptidoglycan-N-acetylglucosamine deacetylase